MRQSRQRKRNEQLYTFRRIQFLPPQNASFFTDRTDGLAYAVLRPSVVRLVCRLQEMYCG